MNNSFLIKDFSEYFKNISPKVITKVVKKQVGVICVIPFVLANEIFDFFKF